MPQNISNESGEIENNIDDMNNYFGELSLWGQKQKNVNSSFFQINDYNNNDNININNNNNHNQNILNNNNNNIKNTNYK